MSNTARIAATAANTLVKPLDVSDVFSTYLYEGNSVADRDIVNNIDLAGEGGLVWIKNRTTTGIPHNLHDTERSMYNLRTNETAGQYTGIQLTANSNGFNTTYTGSGFNQTGEDYASWTFRKAPKFFDVVTYTGDGTSSRAISHSLGSTPGCIIIKRTDASAAWTIFHRGLSGGITGSRILFDTSAATSGSNITAVDDSTFTVISTGTNASGGTYVAYLFAHNDGDGDFGPTGDQDIIKCGGITNAVSGVNTIDLGFEAQWVMIKRTDIAGDWYMADVMRGAPTLTLSTQRLFANTSSAESADPLVGPHPTGFQFNNQWGTSSDWVYIAIRRGPMAVPESATDVFDVEYSNQNGDGYYANLGAVTDTWLYRVKNTTSNWILRSRLTGANYLHTNLTSAETSQSFSAWDNMNGVGPTGVTAATNTNEYNWVWKRAPNYFDVVAYTGNNTAGNAISHNLGVVPEMMWIKSRSNAVNWIVYHKDLNGGTNPEDYYLILNSTNAEANDSTGDYFNSTAPTATNFTLGSSYWVNGTSNIAYLFASLDGISKVGSYTGNGTSTGDAQNIDCGFSSGARFVLIKASSAAYSWLLFDTERGITSGNDSLLILNDTDAETTAFDSVDPYSSGFTAVQGPYNVNQSGVEYIFYAIA